MTALAISVIIMSSQAISALSTCNGRNHNDSTRNGSKRWTQINVKSISDNIFFVGNESCNGKQSSSNASLQYKLRHTGILENIS